MRRVILAVEARSSSFGGRCVQARAEVSDDGSEEPDNLALDADEERVLNTLVARVAGACAALDEGVLQRSGERS